MKRSGFTMIELIFVIVILGILAAVAIPRLAATRDDAQVSKLASNVKTLISEIGAYTVSQGAAPTEDINMSLASNTYSEGKLTGYYGTVAANTTNGGTITVWDKATGTAGRLQCAHIDVNATTIVLGQDSNGSAICKGINTINPSSSIAIAGQGVKM